MLDQEDHSPPSPCEPSRKYRGCQQQPGGRELQLVLCQFGTASPYQRGSENEVSIRALPKHPYILFCSVSFGGSLKGGKGWLTYSEIFVILLGCAGMGNSQVGADGAGFSVMFVYRLSTYIYKHTPCSVHS